MFNSTPTRRTFSAMSALFGGLGVFFLYLGFEDPSQLSRALIFLGSAISLVWSLQRCNQRPTEQSDPDQRRL